MPPLNRLPIAQQEYQLPLVEDSSSYFIGGLDLDSARHLHAKAIHRPKIQSVTVYLPCTKGQWRLQSSSAAVEKISQTQIETPPLSAHLRKIMRTLPHSVVVLTTSSPSTPSTATQTSGTPESTYRGMTLSSFTTLTLTPSPIITFNIRQPSRTLDALRDSKNFLIHILGANKTGSRIAHTFTQGGGGVDGFRNLNVEEENVVLEDTEGRLVLPRLKGDGVIRALRCKVLGDNGGECRGMIKVGDHVLVLANVEEILKDEAVAENTPHGLCYVDGRYRMTGEAIEVEPLENITVQ